MMKKFVKNLNLTWADERKLDQGRMVETVLLVAGFAVVAVLVTTWIGNAVAGQAHLVATYCIGQAQEITGQTGGASDATVNKCQGTQATDLSLKQSNMIENTKGGRF